MLQSNGHANTRCWACLFEGPTPKHPNGPPGTGFCEAETKGPKAPTVYRCAVSESGPLPHNRANSADFARSQEFPGSTRLRGGHGRIRTSNQTVMSGRPADRRAPAQLGLRARALAPRMRMAGTPGEAHHDSVVRGRSEAPGQRAFKQER